MVKNILFYLVEGTVIECGVEKEGKKVRPSGLEPETYCLEGNCSIQLSYGRIHT